MTYNHFNTNLPLLNWAAKSLREGKADEAALLYQKVLVAQPANFTALHMLGIIRARQGRLQEALNLIGRAINIDPRSPEALVDYGNALMDLGRPEKTLEFFDRALAIRPNYADAWNNRGVALRGMKRFAEALGSFDRALAIMPKHFGALYNRSNALIDLSRFDQALESFDRALAISPNHADSWTNRGVALRGMKRFAEALSSFNRALTITPNEFAALHNRGGTLCDLERPQEALADLDKALAINPNYADTWHNRGLALQSLKRFADALSCHERALAIDPNHRHAFDGAAGAALYLCDWPQTARISGEIRKRVVARQSVIRPFMLLGYCGDPSIQLECARNNVAVTMPLPLQPLWEGAAYRHGRIRIAYLSADFHAHATAYLMAGLFERHDRSRFEVSAISFGPDDGSEMRARLVKAFDHFHDVRGQSDFDIATLLRANEIDIAIDLKGHTEYGRLGILRHRPCPVQVHYLGYPGTLGADFIDYIIADPVVAPFDHQPHFAENIVHLPDCYQVNDPERRIADMTPKRADAGLPDEAFVFCCFNSCWKITAPLFDIWMRLLQAVPGSVLWLFQSDNEPAKRLRAEAAGRGIDPARLVFASSTTHAEHLARYHLADLFLDTLPYNAHTTASDALWASLPLVTCMGECFSSRVAASLLMSMGLPELVTHTLEQYEALALKLAKEPSLLLSYRQKLGANRLSYPLFDTDRFRRNIETAFATMFEISQSGETPRKFSIESGN